MIADKTQNTVIGKIEGDVARMSIDEGAMAHIMSILTNMYSDVELAVLREYSTNAYDAHIEAGTKRPIEVSTPSALSPYLRIRDYGTGLSVEDIHDMYSRYGASSKRDTNSQTGMLGIGSKSGLSYADQFTITSVKDGVKLTAVVSRDEDGGGSMTMPDTIRTDEPNGTEVTLPVSRSHSFQGKARSLFQYWPKGTVLLDGKPAPHFSDADVPLVEIADGIYYQASYEAQSYVVMGNVPYPHNFEDAIPGLNRKGRLLCFVPIGSVQFTPSREALHYTRNTKATLEKLVEAYKDGVKDSLQRAADKCDTPFAALEKLIELGNVPGAPPAQALTYRGEALPDDFTAVNYGHEILIHRPGERAPYWSRARVYAQEAAGVPATTFHKSLWIHGYVPQKFTSEHVAKITKHVEDTYPEGQRPTQYVMLRGGKPKSKWIDAARIVDWQDVRKIKLGTAQVNPLTGRPRRLTGSYDLFVDDSYETQVPADDVRICKSLGQRKQMWVNMNVYQARNLARRLSACFPKGYVLACLPANRIEKFKRDFPHFETMREATEAASKAWEKSVGAPARLALAYYTLRTTDYYSRNVHEDLRSLDASRIDDPDLTAAVEACKVDVEALQSKAALLRVTVETPKVTNPLKKYPLFDRNYVKHDHLYLYLNCAYKASKESA